MILRIKAHDATIVIDLSHVETLINFHLSNLFSEQKHVQEGFDLSVQSKGLLC